MEELANLNNKKQQAIQAAFAVEQAQKTIELDALRLHPKVKELNRRAAIFAAGNAIEYALGQYEYEEEQREDADYDVSQNKGTRTN